MESAARLIGRINRASGVLSDEDLARAAWARAVGKKIAAHTQAVALVRSRLIVEVEDPIWQRQLNTLCPQILRNLEQITGKGAVTDIAFRPMTPKRMPQRAELARFHNTTDTLDEAAGIADPVLRRNYRIARKKATA